MPMIQTQRNYVMVGLALPEDRYVATYIMPQHSARYLLCTQPIERLASAVRWAMEMADCMAGPIEIVPIKSEDDLLHRVVETIGFEGLSRTDPEEQRAGRELLTKLGIPL